MPGFDLSHARFVTDPVDIEVHTQANFAITAAAAQSSALDEGIYDLWTTTDCYVKVAPTANDVTTSTGYLLRAGSTVPFAIRKGSNIGAITSGAAGTISFHRVG